MMAASPLIELIATQVARPSVRAALLSDEALRDDLKAGLDAAVHFTDSGESSRALTWCAVLAANLEHLHRDRRSQEVRAEELASTLLDQLGETGSPLAACMARAIVLAPDTMIRVLKRLDRVLKDG